MLDRLTSPLVMGCYSIFVSGLILSSERIVDKNLEVICRPLMVNISGGIPKFNTSLLLKVFAVVATVVLVVGVASINFKNLSVITTVSFFPDSVFGEDQECRWRQILVPR